MKKVVIIAVVVLLVSGCAGQNPKVEDAGSTVAAISVIVEYGKSLDWCPANDLIAFGKMREDSYYDVCIMKPDGSQEICLTDKECPQKHNGNPVWH
ncbi:MAG: hypothetical protein HXS43_07670, partial [Theionarchaea archaeon]|nr:hypothetical protein [Theionarchaea archaeon]